MTPTMPANPTPAEGVVVPLEPDFAESLIEKLTEIAGRDELRSRHVVFNCEIRSIATIIGMAAKVIGRPLSARPSAPTQSAAQTGEACRCSRCVNEAVAAEGGSGFDTRLMQMFLCTQCGNKRCPHATDHRLSCTNSNEAGQEGSSYGPPLYRRDQATLIEAQAAEIEGARRMLSESADLTSLCTTPDRFGEAGSGEVFLRMTAHNAQVRTFLASRTERADG